MSNYCFQQVTALGAPEEIEKFKEFVHGEAVFDVAKLAERLGVETPTSTWSIEISDDLDPNRIVYEMETEWEEDHELVPALAKKFPALKILHEYAEPNMVFGGVSEFVDGNCVFGAHTDDYETLRYRTRPWVTEFLQFWFTEGE